MNALACISKLYLIMIQIKPRKVVRESYQSYLRVPYIYTHIYMSHKFIQLVG